MPFPSGFPAGSASHHVENDPITISVAVLLESGFGKY
jgi:hypothetical protein